MRLLKMRNLLDHPKEKPSLAIAVAQSNCYIATRLNLTGRYMLSDDVIAYAISKPPRNPMSLAFHALAADVQRAQRFVLSREATMLTHSVAQMSAPQVISALNICRMPFPRMWVEFVFKDREDYYKAINYPATHSDRASPPSRLGFLLQQLDEEGRFLEATLVWKHRPNDPCVAAFAGDAPGIKDAVAVGGLSMQINMTEHANIQPKFREDCLIYRRPEAPIQKFVNEAAKENSWKEIATRLTVPFSLYMTPMWNAVADDTNQLRNLLDDSIYDLYSEWRFVIGLLVVLNSRNVVSASDEIHMDKLNKQRVRQNKPQLLSHREIRLSLSSVQRHRMGSGSIDDLIKHLVRGHWKVRKTGVFWWSPYLRGSRGELVNKPRLVVP